MKKIYCTFFLAFLYSLSFAQDNNILYTSLSYHFENISTDSALNIIEKDIAYYFIYNAELTDNDSNIQARFTNCPLAIILDSLFNNPILGYCVLQKQIVIYENKSTEVEMAEKLKEPIFKTVSGIILDSITNLPLPYSTISILNKGVGIISNLEGRFSFKINEHYLSDTLVISHLGFKPIFLNISEIEKYKTFKLKEKSISLQEILIRWTDPGELLRKALRSIKKNYPVNPSQLRAFYRESLKRNDKYMVYTEGLLDVYKAPYRPTLFQDKAKLLQVRKFTNIESSDTILIKLQGGIEASLRLDLLRSPLDFIKLSTLHLYNYIYSGIETINGIDAHTIKFEPSSENKMNLYGGSIHIDPKSLAIIRIQFSLIKQNARKLAQHFVLNSKPGIKVIPKKIEYIISYKKSKNIYNINHISGDLLFKVKRKRKLLSSNYKLHFEMVTTDIKTINIQRISREDKVKSHQILSDIRFSYLENLNQYWGVNNFILPENNLLKALNKFKIEELYYGEEEEINK